MLYIRLFKAQKLARFRRGSQIINFNFDTLSFICTSLLKRNSVEGLKPSILTKRNKDNMVVAPSVLLPVLPKAACPHCFMVSFSLSDSLYCCGCRS